MFLFKEPTYVDYPVAHVDYPVAYVDYPVVYEEYKKILEKITPKKVLRIDWPGGQNTRTVQAHLFIVSKVS